MSSVRMWKEKLETENFVVFPQSYKFTSLIDDIHAVGDMCDPDQGITLEMDLKFPEAPVIGEERVRMCIK